MDLVVASSLKQPVTDFDFEFELAKLPNEIFNLIIEKLDIVRCPIETVNKFLYAKRNWCSYLRHIYGKLQNKK